MPLDVGCASFVVASPHNQGANDFDAQRRLSVLDASRLLEQDKSGHYANVSPVPLQHHREEPNGDIICLSPDRKVWNLRLSLVPTQVSEGQSKQAPSGLGRAPVCIELMAP